VKWATISELESEGFNLYRSAKEKGTYAKVNAKLIRTKGSSQEGATYSFSDGGAKKGQTYYYKLDALDSKGKATTHGPIMVKFE
jgi:hypothetical protein